MKSLFTNKNVLMLTLVALIAVAVMYMMSKKEAVTFNNQFKTYEYSDDDILSENDTDLNGLDTTLTGKTKI